MPLIGATIHILPCQFEKQSIDDVVHDDDKVVLRSLSYQQLYQLYSTPLIAAGVHTISVAPLPGPWN